MTARPPPWRVVEGAGCFIVQDATDEIEASGVTSMRGIAMALNARNIPTTTGRKKWQALQVRRVLARL
jgi:hypothetical protein